MIIWLCATFEISCLTYVKLLVGSLHKDLERTQGLGPTWFTLIRKLVWFHVIYFHGNFPPTLIGLFSVVSHDMIVDLSLFQLQMENSEAEIFSLFEVKNNQTSLHSNFTSCNFLYLVHKNCERNCLFVPQHRGVASLGIHVRLAWEIKFYPVDIFSGKNSFYVYDLGLQVGPLGLGLVTPLPQ